GIKGTWALMARDHQAFADAMVALHEAYPEMVEAMGNYGLALALVDRKDEAIEWLRNSLGRQQAARYRDNPTLGELVSLGLLAWLFEDRGDEANAALYRDQMPELFRRLRENGRAPGIDGLL